MGKIRDYHGRFKLRKYSKQEKHLFIPYLLHSGLLLCWRIEALHA